MCFSETDPAEGHKRPDPSQDGPLTTETLEAMEPNIDHERCCLWCGEWFETNTRLQSHLQHCEEYTRPSQSNVSDGVTGAPRVVRAVSLDSRPPNLHVDLHKDETLSTIVGPPSPEAREIPKWGFPMKREAPSEQVRVFFKNGAFAPDFFLIILFKFVLVCLTDCIRTI